MYVKTTKKSDSISLFFVGKYDDDYILIILCVVTVPLVRVTFTI